MQNSGPSTASARVGANHSRADELARWRRDRARADAIRGAVTSSASELLRSLTPDRSISKVLELIGMASGVSRIQLYENRSEPDGRIVSALRQEWDAPGVTSVAALQKSADITASTLDRDRMVPFLAKGEVVGLLAREAAAPFRRVLEVGGIKSVLMVPIFVDDKWWGQMGFDDCEHERIWSALEVDTLKTLAEIIGAALARAHDLKMLSDASRVIENSPVLLYRIDPKKPYALTYLSHNVSRYGYDVDALLASPSRYLELFHPDDLPDVLADLARIATGQTEAASRERRIRASDGHYVWVEDRTRGLYDAQHRLTTIEGIAIDIDERKAAESEIVRFSLLDPLTGLANRKAFMSELDRAFAAAWHGGAGFAMHYIDLDRFKDINDVLGHSKGDALLKAVAERLLARRRSGDMIARFGGDEFAVLQVDISDPSDAGAFAARILQELAEPFDVGIELHVTASIGIAVFAHDVAGPEEMIKQADVALYRAKELGRNQYHFHSEQLDTATIERVTLGGDLRRGLERGEVEVYYQPQVDLETRRIVGLEALARWHHPKQGLLCPSRFVPIAEQNGTILQLGRQIIEDVCRQIVHWGAEQLAPPVVAINVSAEQFKATPEFDCELSQRLRHWGVAPDALELELTESVLMETTRQHGEIIDRLRALGVAIAIDDFGTGYSSLGYLRAYRVNHIKIAQEFVRDIQVDSGDVAIVRAAISLGRELGIAVIAEGVETEHQLGILARAGCRYIQGFYFSPPVPAKHAAELLRRGTLPPAAASAGRGSGS